MVRYTQVSNATILISNGEPIDVSRVTISSLAGGSCIANLFEADGITTIATLQVRSTGTFANEISGSWRAIKGLTVTCQGTGNCTVYYSQSGA